MAWLLHIFSVLSTIFFSGKPDRMFITWKLLCTHISLFRKSKLCYKEAPKEQSKGPHNDATEWSTHLRVHWGMPQSWVPPIPAHGPALTHFLFPVKTNNFINIYTKRTSCLRNSIQCLGTCKTDRFPMNYKFSEGHISLPLYVKHCFLSNKRNCILRKN